jgi:hypothetical protein
MALIACPECGQTVLDVASMCPHCGTDLRRTTERFDYVTGRQVGLTPRPAAQLARRPFRFPTTLGLALMIGGGLVVVLGSFLPWARGPAAEPGVSGSGAITLAVGIVIALLGFSARVSPSYFPRYLTALGAVVTLGVAWIGRPSNGWGGGLRLVVLGALMALIGTVRRER